MRNRAAVDRAYVKKKAKEGRRKKREKRGERMRGEEEKDPG